MQTLLADVKQNQNKTNSNKTLMFRDKVFVSFFVFPFFGYEIYMTWNMLVDLCTEMTPDREWREHKQNKNKGMPCT